MAYEIEIWKDVEGYEDYLKVSNLGNVIRKARAWKAGNKGSTMSKRETLLKPRLTLGYQTIDVQVNGICKSLKVHRLVATAFIPNPENKTQVNHIDLNRANPHVSNLEWVTAKENIRHARATKTDWKKNSGGPKGESSGKAKLTEEDVLSIRASNLEHLQLAKMYNINPSNISRIRNRQHWKHI